MGGGCRGVVGAAGNVNFVFTDCAWLKAALLHLRLHSCAPLGLGERRARERERERERARRVSGCVIMQRL